jgi:cysteine desulfurase/selenocysteine lyase
VGTPNIFGIVGLGAAIDYINSIGIERIENYIFHLTKYLYDKLLTIDGIEFNKGIDTCKCILGYGIVTFKHNRISSEEINDILNYYKIFVRSNNFCQEDQDQYIRVSLNIYNTKRDIDKLIKVLSTINEQ